MSGTWSGQVWGGQMEEHWTTLEGATMLGLNRVIKDGKTIHREFVSIETHGAEAALHVNVFREPLALVTYELTRSESNIAIFSNPQHSRLTTMIYERRGDSLVITLRGMRNNQPYHEEISLESRIPAA